LFHGVKYSKRTLFCSFFVQKASQNGVYNCIFLSVPNDTFKNAQTAKKGEYYAS
jgi:hypothetical protein